MNVDPANWVKVNKLLDEALKRPQSEHADWLRTLASEYAEFEPLLRRLLSRAAVVETRDFLEELPAIEIALSPSPSSDQHMGPYRLVRQLGSGGMASVWLAERIDGLIDRPVALKLPHPALSKIFAQRAERERDFLAKLNHPNIARLYDAGVTDTGQPYLALEYIEGVPIDQYCRDKNLDIRARVQLFCSVIDAMSHAHSKLIIHRDVKPSNVLVGEDRRVRLVDFGIAKLLEHEKAFATELTRVGGRALTTAYAAPEHISGDSLTVAADIYSLGVLLYEILAGQRPYAEFEGSAHELESAALQGLPKPPSQATASSTVARTIVGDLDVIVLKAMAKEPERRYATCHAFGEDLRRFLANEPVLAQPASLAYRTRKFASRHKTGIAAAVVVSVALVAVAVTSVHSAVTSARQTRQILAERDKAEQLSDFLISIFELSSPNKTKGETVTALELLNRSAERVRTDMDGQPLRQATLMHSIAVVYSEMAQNETAKDLLQEVRALHVNSGNEISADYADSTELLAELREVEGALDEADAMFRQAVEIRQSLGSPKNLAMSLLRLGRLQHKKGQVEDAESLYRRALALRRSVDNEHDDTVANAMSYIGSILQQRGELDEAEAMQNEALEIRRSLHGNDHIVLLESHYNLGVVSLEKNDLDAAHAHFHEGLRISIKLVPERDQSAAFFYDGLGRLNERAGDLNQAAENFQRSVDVYTRIYSDTHMNTGIVEGNLGRVLAKRGSFAQAEVHLRNGISNLSAAVPSHRYLPRMRLYLGRSLAETGQSEEARDLLETAYSELNELHGPEHDYTLEAQHLLATLGQ